MVVYWNHQNSSCRTGGSSGGNGNGHYSHYSSGATFRTSVNATDCCLVEMKHRAERDELDLLAAVTQQVDGAVFLA